MKELLFPWEKESFVPAMQHGCRAKPLLQSVVWQQPIVKITIFCYFAPVCFLF